MLQSLAQTTSLDLYSLIPLGLGPAAFGLVVWVVRHATTKTFPALVADFKATNQAQLETFERVSREQRAEFREMQQADRELHHRREEAIRSEFRAAFDKFETAQERFAERLDDPKP